VRLRVLRSVLRWFGFTGYDDHRDREADRAGAPDPMHRHSHTHGVVDASVTTSEQGVYAIKWSFITLAVTAALQFAIVFVSGSVALLADTIHNVADATTAIPLWVAFTLARRKPSATFTYGYGRVEDFAGIVIVLIILGSALVAGYEAIDRFIHPQAIRLLPWVAIAGVIGFIGNEAVAVFRIRVGRQIDSAALIADGYHARTDGLTSLAVVGGAAGGGFGFPLADPIVGLMIALAIFGIVWQSSKAVLTRALDGVEPHIIDEIRHAAEQVPGVEIREARARWLGHRLHADIVMGVDPGLSVADATGLAERLKSTLHSHLPALADAPVSVVAKR
jgi:cation diffusion facilitator family transporter